MRIGLIDVDGHNFPNIPLMKLSAWHKSKGDAVEWYNVWKGYAEPYDIVYMSKVFSFTPDFEPLIYSKQIIKGGFGYDNIPEEYELYKKDIENMDYCEGLIYIAEKELERDERHNI